MTATARPLADLARRDHDLVVVGAGIHGCLAVLDAARRGLRVALVEASDFGAATSWASHRILHGGLRYLQGLDLARARRSIAERRWFLRTFPDLCVPLACALPLYGDGLRRPGPFGVALAVNAVLGARRNAGVRPDRRLPNGSVAPPSRAREANPLARREGLRAVGVWHDGLVTSHARLTMEILRWAASLDALIARDARAVALRTARAGVVGLDAEDARTGERFTLRTGAVINAAGPWCHDVAGALDPASVGRRAPATLAFNLLLDRPAPHGACAVTPPGPGARTYFLVPRHELMIAGTGHVALGAPRARPSEGEVRAMLDDLNRASPSLSLSPADVLRVDAGVLRGETTESAEPADRPVIADHARSGGPEGLVSLSGVKYTTARADAAAAVRLAAGPRPITPRGRARPPADPLTRDLNLASPAWARRADLAPLAPALRALAEREGVRTLGDLMLRRTEWGQDPRGLDALARRVGAALGWPPDRVEREASDLVQAPPAMGPMTPVEAARP